MLILSSFLHLLLFLYVVIGDMKPIHFDTFYFYTNLFTLSIKGFKLIKMLARRVSASFQNMPLSSLPHFKKESG